VQSALACPLDCRVDERCANSRVAPIGSDEHPDLAESKVTRLDVKPTTISPDEIAMSVPFESPSRSPLVHVDR
jgi:hypothetical protein